MSRMKDEKIVGSTLTGSPPISLTVPTESQKLVLLCLSLSQCCMLSSSVLAAFSSPSACFPESSPSISVVSAASISAPISLAPLLSLTLGPLSLYIEYFHLNIFPVPQTEVIEKLTSYLLDFP